MIIFFCILTNCILFILCFRLFFKSENKQFLLKIINQFKDDNKYFLIYFIAFKTHF